MGPLGVNSIHISNLMRSFKSEKKERMVHEMDEFKRSKSMLK